MHEKRENPRRRRYYYRLHNRRRAAAAVKLADLLNKCLVNSKTLKALENATNAQKREIQTI